MQNQNNKLALKLAPDLNGNYGQKPLQPIPVEVQPNYKENIQSAGDNNVLNQFEVGSKVNDEHIRIIEPGCGETGQDYKCPDKVISESVRTNYLSVSIVMAVILILGVLVIRIARRRKQRGV